MSDAPPAIAEGGKALTNGAKSVPPWVWIAAVGGGVVFAYVSSRKKGGTTNTDTTQPGAFVYTGTGGNDNSTPSAPTANTGFQTNEAWAQAAKNYLISQGVDAKEASDAVDLYINAQALNNKQNAMISTVTRQLGAPPQSLPPVTGTPTTPTTPSTPTSNDPNSNPSVWGSTPRQNPKSVAGTVYTTQFENEPLINMVKYAYGLADWDYSSQVYASNQLLNANHNVITDVTHIPKGTKLYFPVLSSEEFPGFGTKVPQFGYTGGPNSTGEWQIDTGFVPSSANAPRDAQARQV